MLFKRKKYGHILSLGYNCEVSFQFFLKYHFVESSLFAWVNAINCKRLIATLQNLDCLASKGFKKEGIMYEDVASGILFHGKNMDTEDDEKEELKSRILHLKEKFIKTANDGKKNLYIFKYPSLKVSLSQVEKDIMDLYNILKKLGSNDFDLLIILEKDFCSDLHFDVSNIYIRRVKFFTPEARVTSKPYDEKSFGKIFSEFVPNFKLPQTKHFKFEDTENKKSDIIPIKKYDLIFSLGAACSCAQTIKEAHLRRFSSPFDWLWGSCFSDRVNLLCSDFQRFLSRADLTSCGCNNGDEHNLCDIYKNEYTKLVLNHDFPAGKELDVSYDAIKEKYDRRINRLLSEIKKAKDVLIMYMETPSSENIITDEILVTEWQKIKEKYPQTNINILYWQQNNKYNPRQYKIDYLNEHISKITANYKLQIEGAAPYAVDLIFTSKILKKICKLRLPLYLQIKNLFMRFLIGCIPIKAQRKRLRKKYHV